MTKDKDQPIHEVHRLKAIDHFLMAERAINPEDGVGILYEQAIMNCHLGLEMAMKSVVYKEGGTPPTSGADGHNLLKISQCKVKNKKILHHAIKNASHILPFWDKVHSTWDTNKRYEFMNLEEGDYDELYEAYTRFYGWIKNKFNL